MKIKVSRNCPKVWKQPLIRVKARARASSPLLLQGRRCSAKVHGCRPKPKPSCLFDTSAWRKRLCKTQTECCCPGQELQHKMLQPNQGKQHLHNKPHCVTEQSFWKVQHGEVDLEWDVSTCPLHLQGPTKADPLRWNVHSRIAVHRQTEMVKILSTEHSQKWSTRWEKEAKKRKRISENLREVARACAVPACR